MGREQLVIPGLKLWLRLEHAVASRHSHPEAVFGSGNESELVVVSLSAAPSAPRFAVEEPRKDYASQRQVERRFPRN